MVAAGAAFAAAAAAARRRPKRPRALLLLLLMAAAGLLSSSRPAAVAAFLHHHPTISILRQQPRTAATTIRHRSSSTVHTNAFTGARDFFLDIPDTTLPDCPLRRVHVMDTGAPSAPTDNPPLVLIGGTAQIINSWVGHTSFLARERRFIIYEARGQGRTELDLAGASMPAHVEDLKRVCAALGLDAQPFDLVGFSFGARVALAAAATHPAMVRRLVLTGVPADRDAQGRLILQSWRASLERGDLQGFAWSSMLLCHGPSFLSNYESKIPEWVDFVVKNNRAEAILSIVSKSHTTDLADPYHNRQLARRVQCPTLLLGGQEDRVAAASEIERLAAEAKKGWPVVLLPRCGHNVVFEDPSAWRKEVQDFLSA